MPATQRPRLKHWSKNVREVTIFHDSLHMRIEGGAENGEFLYIGGFTASDEIRYRKGKLHVGDILIEVNDQAVVGFTLQGLMNRINQAGKKVHFKVVEPGGGISKDLRNYLTQEFPSSNEVDLDLQDTIRDNLYSRTVPCTTRPRRPREEPGIDYIFISPEKFKEMEKNGDFIETGSYNDHFYGTLKPKLIVESMADLAIKKDAKKLDNDSSETSSKTNDVDQVTVHAEANGHIKTNNENNEVNDIVKKESDLTQDEIVLDKHFIEV